MKLKARFVYVEAENCEDAPGLIAGLASLVAGQNGAMERPALEGPGTIEAPALPSPNPAAPRKKRGMAAPQSSSPSPSRLAKRERIKDIRDKLAASMLKNGPMSAGEIKNHYGINDYQLKQLFGGCEWFIKDESNGHLGKYDLTPGGRAAAKVVAAAP